MAALALIAAVARNRVIGRNNALPWHLPEDLAYFKRVTLGKPIIMGRHTFDSIGRPLPGRANIVVSTTAGYAPRGVQVVADLATAEALAADICLIDGAAEALVIGGARLYAGALGHARRMYLTEVHADVAGDVLFPEVDWSQWREIGRERHAAAGANPYDYSFVVYDRV